MLYNQIFKKIIFPLMEMYSETSIQKNLLLLNESQWWPEKRMISYQNKKLRDLINHCYRNVPYYNSLFNRFNLKPQDIKCKEDLGKLPILTKDIIRKNFNDMIARNYRSFKPQLDKTGGSTGDPLTYYSTKEAISLGWAATYRGWQWAGWELGDKRATLGGYSLMPGESVVIKKRLRNFFERNLPISVTSMDSKLMKEYLTQIIQFKPKYLRGYPSALTRLASFIEQSKISGVRPRAIFCTAELLLPNYRKKIQDVFCCDVFDGYGLRDGNGNAMECAEHRGLHVSQEISILEVVQNGKAISNGNVGDILFTDLHNYAMPFIRYYSGDVGSFSEVKCLCGRNLPVLKSIKGRTTDIILFKNSRSLSGPAMTLIFSQFPIQRYQLVQKTEDKLCVLIIKAEGFTKEHETRIRNTLEYHLSKQVQIEIQYPSEIGTTESGKHHFILSEVR